MLDLDKQSNNKVAGTHYMIISGARLPGRKGLSLGHCVNAGNSLQYSQCTCPAFLVQHRHPGIDKNRPPQSPDEAHCVSRCVVGPDDPFDVVLLK